MTDMYSKESSGCGTLLGQSCAKKNPMSSRKKLTDQNCPLVMTCNKIFRRQNKIELSFAQLLKMYGSCSLEAGQRFSNQLIKPVLPSLLVSLPLRIGAI